MLQSARLRYCRPVNHSSWISAKTAEVNLKTESSLGKMPTTRVRRRIGVRVAMEQNPGVLASYRGNYSS